jgi:hypothetical protein
MPGGALAASHREWQYLHAAERKQVSLTLDIADMARPAADDLQLDLILDYRDQSSALSRVSTVFS